MNSMIVCFLACGVFVGLAVVAQREIKQVSRYATGYSASNRAGMQNLIDQVTVPEVRKLRPISKMPPKKGLHWVSLARVAAQTPEDGFTDALTAYQRERQK